MALYVVRVPNPPPGVDWLAAVPGQYLYNVTGITATLDTTGGGGPSSAIDSSGNHNTGTYQGTWTHHVPGLVAGNFASQVTDNLEDVESSFMPFDFTGDYTFEAWIERADPTVTLLPFLVGDTGGAPIIQVWIAGTADPHGDPAGAFRIEAQGAAGPFVTPGGLFTDPGPHLVEVEASPSNGDITIFVDGHTAWFFSPAPWVPPLPPQRIQWATSAGASGATWDEMALYPFEITGAQAHQNFLNASISFAAYSAGVLALGPSIYYHLDDPIVTAGRQVLLNVTNGTERVLLVPTGFAESATPGVFSYSWQPQLQSATQTPDQLVTTVPIPTLVLPAGYSMGTNTPDLGPLDQWSDISIWWNSNVMDAQNPPNPYAYPPGARLRPVYEPGTG